MLPGHTAFISELEVGEVKVELPDATRYYAISGGFLEVVQDRVLLLLETAEAAEDIDVERAQQAKQRATDRLNQKSAGNTEIDFVKAEAALSRAVNRLNTASRNST